MDAKIKSKHAQITIFVIIAILIVVVFLLFFLLLRQKQIETQQMLEPNSYIEACTKDAVEKAVDIMLAQGGYISPVNYKLYESHKVAYLCYNKNYYSSCINQEPNYLVHLESEITSYIKPKIDECFYLLQGELANKGYGINAGALSVKTEVVPNRIEVEINKKFDISRNEETRKYDKFSAKKSSPLFELSEIAREIVNQEAKYCNFEYVGFMIFYSKFNIDKKNIGEGETASKIYIIEDRKTGKKLNIAIRSCAIPAGF